MSISSSIAADYSNTIKEEWQRELRQAYHQKDWLLVGNLLKKMEQFQFTE